MIGAWCHPCGWLHNYLSSGQLCELRLSYIIQQTCLFQSKIHHYVCFVMNGCWVFLLEISYPKTSFEVSYCEINRIEPTNHLQTLLKILTEKSFQRKLQKFLKRSCNLKKKDVAWSTVFLPKLAILGKHLFCSLFSETKEKR